MSFQLMQHFGACLVNSLQQLRPVVYLGTCSEVGDFNTFSLNETVLNGETDIGKAEEGRRRPLSLAEDSFHTDPYSWLEGYDKLLVGPVCTTVAGDRGQIEEE